MELPMTVKGINFIGFFFLLILLVPACVSTPVSPKSSKKCLDCHSDWSKKYQEGILHKPIRDNNCEVCHRPHGVVGGVFLRQNVPNLCYSCHKNLIKTSQLSSVHKPFSDG